MLNSNALTTVEKVKSHLSIAPSVTLEDARLIDFINAASDYIESFCERKFKAMDHIELISVEDKWGIMPIEYPINSVTELAISHTQEWDNASAIVDPTAYFISDKQTRISFIQSRARSRKSVRLKYNAGYTAIPGDLELACIWLVEWYYRQRQRADIGKTSMSKGDESIGIVGQVPSQINELLHRYKRNEFGYYIGDAFSG
jgi:hypothetical protein